MERISCFFILLASYFFETRVLSWLTRALAGLFTLKLSCRSFGCLAQGLETKVKELCLEKLTSALCSDIYGWLHAL